MMYLKKKKKAKQHVASCFVPCPAWVVRKRCVLNTNSHDNKCFAWVLLRARHPVVQSRRRSVDDLRPHLEEVALPEGVRYPIPLQHEVFHQIEQLNPWCSFSVFILGEEAGSVRSFYVSKLKYQRPLHVCVGAIQHPVNPQHAHYVFIRRFEYLMGKDVNFLQLRYCENCLGEHKTYNIRDHECECYGILPKPIHGWSKEKEEEDEEEEDAAPQEPPLKQARVEEEKEQEIKNNV
jgi:hypothetical protein